MSAPTLGTERTQALISMMGSTTAVGEFIRRIKRMERDAAAKEIESIVPEASDDIKSALLNLIPEDVFEIPFPRGKQYAVLWLCGATYGQVAQMYGITKETAFSGATRYLTQDMRDEVKPHRSKHTTNITPTMFSAYKDILNSWMSNSSHFKLMTQGSVSRIASGVMQEYLENERLFNETEDSAYETINAPNERIIGKTASSEYHEVVENIPNQPDLKNAFEQMFGKK